MKKEKGQFGYRNSMQRMRLLITGILVAAIVAQLLARFLTDNPAAKNILTVMAILTVLPMANMASPLLASWRYRTPTETFHQKVQPYESVCVILYDLILTTKEYVLPMDVIAVHPNGVYAYCTAKKKDPAKAEKALNELFYANRLKLKVKLIWEENSLWRRLECLKPADPAVDDGTVEYVVSLLKSLSM
ncbi:MAG: O-linked GlcNAc transferase-like protein [Lachnospiraceae bacterium]|nr:O-linked GlcNAc transferase-like protein [Lachnospiraceae bacterium]